MNQKKIHTRIEKNPATCTTCKTVTTKLQQQH